MAFRGWWALSDDWGLGPWDEFANSSRIIDHLVPRGTPSALPDQGFALDETPDDSLLYDPTPTRTIYDLAPGPLDETPDDSLLFDPGTAVDPVRDLARCGCTLKAFPRDTWAGLRETLDGKDEPYTITDAPWYTPTAPASGEFVGVWVMGVEGLDSAAVSRTVTQSIGPGGTAGPSRAGTRQITFDALIVGCTNAGARFGLSWLSRALRPTTERRGAVLSFFDAHPDDTAADPVSLLRQIGGVVLTSAPEVRSTSGHQGAQASVLRVSFTLTATDAHVWGVRQTILSRDDLVTETVPISWAHAPDCDADRTCDDLPMLLSDECAPPDVRVPPAVVPTCGGCVPLCEYERRTAVLDLSRGDVPITPGSEIAVSIRVHGPSSANIYWRPCGSTDPCDEGHRLAISGLPEQAHIIADSVFGRVSAFDGQGRRVRQVGIVSALSGEPWRPMVVDSDMCYEIVIDTAPDLPDPLIDVYVQERHQ